MILFAAIFRYGMINLTAKFSYSILYMALLASFNFEDMKDFLLSNIVFSKRIPNFLRIKDKKRKK